MSRLFDHTMLDMRKKGDPSAYPVGTLVIPNTLTRGGQILATNLDPIDDNESGTFLPGTLGIVIGNHYTAGGTWWTCVMCATGTGWCRSLNLTSLASVTTEQFDIIRKTLRDRGV